MKFLTFLYRSCRAALLMIGMLAGASGAQAEQPLKVVASLRPLGLLAAEVLGTQGTVDVLMPAGATPHDFQLSPRQLARLQQADWVLWAGPEVEPYLARAMAAVKAPVIDASALPGIRWLPARSLHRHESAVGHEHHHESAPDDDHHHLSGEGEHPAHDLHFWLDSGNAGQIAGALAMQMGLPFDARAFSGTLEDSLLQAKARLERPVPLVVYHDAYQYLENSLGVKEVHLMALDQQTRGGLRQLGKLAGELKGASGACFVGDPGFSRQVAPLAERVHPQARFVAIDPLAGTYPLQAGAYAQFFRDALMALADCLASPQSTSPR